MIAVDRLLSDGRSVHVRTTDRRDGDLCIDLDPAELDARRRALVDRPWVWARQVHGADVVVLDAGDEVADRSGRSADALVTDRDDVALAVHGADCATIGLWTDGGVIAAVHAGWRGLLAGAVEAAVERVGSGSEVVHAVVGPTIGPECYEFGAVDLEAMRSRFGDTVVSSTTGGAASLDVRAAFDVLADECGLDVVARDRTCTACDADRLWSHRARGDSSRQALVIWIDR